MIMSDECERVEEKKEGETEGSCTEIRYIPSRTCVITRN